MSAVAQIEQRAKELLVRHRPGQLSIKVGRSAYYSIVGQIPEKVLPESMFGIRVERTENFPGWEIYCHGREVE